MIQSAMMFALGFFVCGLFGLMFLSAFARRTRRVAEQRLLKRLSSHRGEFDAEIAAMRAQHAVSASRLEREAGAMRDMATAYRLESDLKDHEVFTARSDLESKVMEVDEINVRMQDLHNQNLSLERQAAEYGSALRSARRALEIELDKHNKLQEAFDRALGMVDGRLIEIRALRAESDHLRDIAESLRPGSTRSVSQVVPMDVDDHGFGHLAANAGIGSQPPAGLSADELIAQQAVVFGQQQPSAHHEPSVAAPAPATPNGQGVSAIENATEEIRRMTDEVQSGLPHGEPPLVSPNNAAPIPSVEPEQHAPAPIVSIDPSQANLVAGNDSAPMAPTKQSRRKLTRRSLKAREPRLDGGPGDGAVRSEDVSPDARFQDAVKEIRALSQSAGGRRAPGE